MFEQVMLTGSGKGKRVWTTCAGVTGQLALVAGMVVAPMVWPQAMPQATFTLLVPTAPAGRAPNREPEVKHAPSIAPKAIRRLATVGLVQPTRIPLAIVIDKELPEAFTNVGPGNGVRGGTGPEIGDGFLVSIIGDAGKARPKDPPVVPAQPPDPPALPVRRVVEGGVVKLASVTYRVEPRYPQLAVISHVEGVVKLRGVIATDGRIIDLAVESGHPLLAPAALEAVRQWRYVPTFLDGLPVEVVTTIAVTFRLNR